VKVQLAKRKVYRMWLHSICIEVLGMALERAVVDFIRVVDTKASNGAEKHIMLDEAVVELNMALKSVLIEIVYIYTQGESKKVEQSQRQS